MTQRIGSLGHGPLGHTPLGSSGLMEEAIEIRERLHENLKTPYPDHEGTTWDHILTAVALEIATLAHERERVKQQTSVELATGRHLDRIGEMVFTPRLRGEDDDLYRARLRIQLRMHASGGTIMDIKETCAMLINTEPIHVDVDEPFETEPARVSVAVDGATLSAAPIGEEDLGTFLHDVKAGGVALVGTQIGSFTYRDESDFVLDVNDPELGYGNGRYSGIITPS